MIYSCCGGDNAQLNAPQTNIIIKNNGNENVIYGKINNAIANEPITIKMVFCTPILSAIDPPSAPPDTARSEERRVGKECRCRWSREYERKNINKSKNTDEV